MPTLKCSTCGATYYTAASDRLLDLVLVMFGCEACDEGAPLHVTRRRCCLPGSGARAATGLAHQLSDLAGVDSAAREV